MQITVEQINDPKIKEKYVIPEKEVKRYLGAVRKTEITDEVESMMRECIGDVFEVSGFRSCYVRVPIEINDTDVINFSFFKTQSHDLAKNLAGCSEAVIFAATVGSGVDRLIRRAELLSPVKLAFYQAAGAADVENYCNDLNRRIDEMMAAEGYKGHWRFSPGYGDLSITNQRYIIDELQCTSKIGITLTQQYMMMPSKSVTAIIGYEKI